jgi:hypothetical protein
MFNRKMPTNTKTRFTQWLDRLRDWSDTTKTPVEWAVMAQLGPCPSCGGRFTRDCHDAPGINNAAVGVCVRCAHLWCLECGAELTIDDPKCSHWDKAS